MQITFSILTLLFIVVSVALVLIVLVQRPQGGGLTGAFGGGGGTDTAFGGRTGDALTVATITAFTIYLLIAIGLNITSNVMLNQPAETEATPAANTTTEVPGTVVPPTDPSKPMSIPAEEVKKLLSETAPASPTSANTPVETPLPAGAPSATPPAATPPATTPPAAPGSGGF